MALKDKFGGAPWYSWEESLKLRQTEAIWNARHELQDEIRFYSFVQYLFHVQWSALRAYAHENGIRIIGDVPIYVPYDSADVWSSPEYFQLDEQIRKVIMLYEPQWTEKDIELDVELERLSYLGNEPMMRHVWDNLISNAVKFSPQGGTIKLRLTRKPEKLVFTIEDQGSGLSEETQKHIFDKFYQGDSSHKQEGNGLGLALVKRILTIEKGQITAENIPEGGCRFTVTLRTK